MDFLGQLNTLPSDMVFRSDDNKVSESLISINYHVDLGLRFRNGDQSYSIDDSQERVIELVRNVDGVAGSYVDSHYTQTSMMPIWTVIQIMLLVSIVLGFVKRSKMVVPHKEPAPVQVSNGTPEISTARELKMYKELLDEGTITQEEFDAKKKQLLGL